MKMPTLNKKHLYAAIVGMIVIAALVAIYEGYLGKKEVAASGLAMIGTFCGALFAFRLNENKEAEKERSRRISALNRAFFTIARQRNAVSNYVRWVPKEGNVVQLAFNLPANQPPNYADLRHDFDSLYFMLESSNPTLLLELSIEQERFQQAFEAIRLRNEFYVSEVQLAMAEKNLNNKLVSSAQLREVMGERIFDGAVNGITNIQSHIHETKDSLGAINEKLLAFCKAEFKGESFTTYQPNA